MRYDEAIDALAATQDGVVTRRQLLNAGLSARRIDDRIASGRLVRIHAGVYLVRGHPASWHAYQRAAVLALGGSAVASHRAAALLHGLAGVEACVEVTVGLSSRPRLAGVIVHRSGAFLPGDIEQRDAMIRTRVGRTLVDLAGVLTRPQLEVAVDDALTRHLVTCDYVLRRLDMLGRKGRKGAAVLADVLADRPGGRPKHQSQFERRLFELLRAAGLPRPTPQYEVHLPGGQSAVLDFAYPSRLLALEADSYRHHSSRLDWSRDHTRNRLLTAMGWRILPVTWEDLGPAASAALIGLVRRSLDIHPPLAG